MNIKKIRKEIFFSGVVARCKMRKQLLVAMVQATKQKLQDRLTIFRALMNKLPESAVLLTAKGKQLSRSIMENKLLKKFKFPFLVKRIAVLLMILMLTVGSVGVYAHLESFAYVVYLDGEEKGYVSSDTEFLAFVAELTAQAEERYGLQVRAVQEVRVEREQRRAAEPNDWAVMDQVRQALIYDVYAYVITVNGKDTLAVRRYEDYEKVIEKLKAAYGSGKENAVIRAVVLDDNVGARKTLVDPAALYAVDRAAEILRRGTDRREVYLVSRGDSLWTIARENNMTVNEIQEANPQLASAERIKPGEEINLVVAEPLVDVSVTQEVALQKQIPFETRYQNDSKLFRGNSRVVQPGQVGIKEVTVKITQTNGNEVLREVIDEVVIKEPQEQIVARGTAAVPPQVGTGRFLWPVSGGRISSPFGQRGRSFHAGVDIAAAHGTAILAADSGVVTAAGWNGGFGIMIAIDHGNGTATLYAHNSSNLVSVGQRVQRGQQIARIGSTGNSTGPHVHFEVHRNGSQVNPLQFF